MRIGILGAGISGLSTALLIKEAGLGDVCVFEKEARPGGLASSAIIDGYTFDLHGGHVFNSKWDEVRQWVFGKMPEEEWIFQERHAKVLFKDRIVDYPFEFALYQLEPEDGVELFRGFCEAGRGEEPENYYDWLIWRFGRPIAERYMIPYNEKIMAYDLARMSTRWARGKMPLPSVKEVEYAFRARDAKERLMPHAFFYYPKQGGIQALVDRLAGGLERELRLNTPVCCVEPDGSGWCVNGEDRFDLLIVTISLKMLLRLMPQAPSDVRRAALDLRTNVISTALCECAAQDISWLYIPDKRFPIHRMVYQGGLAPSNCPSGGMGSSVLLESTGRVFPEIQAREWNARTPLEGLKVGRVIGQTLAESYILYDADYSVNLGAVNSWLDSVNMYRVGRFAEWQYYNMDVCVKKAMELVAVLKRNMAGRTRS